MRIFFINAFLILSLDVFAGATPESDERDYYCDKSNYQEFIYNKRKTRHLINLTKMGCNLAGVDFTNKVFSKATFFKADLSGAIFTDSNLIKVNFKEAILSYADFMDANLVRVNFKNAQLIEADFMDANLVRVNFKNAQLIEADFMDANLVRVNFKNAQLIEADFRGAELYKVNVKNTNFTRADFRDSYLDIVLDKFHSGKVRDAKYNQNTIIKNTQGSIIASSELLNSLGMIEIK